MSTRKAVSTASIKALRATGTPNKSKQTITGPCRKSGKQVANQIRGGGGKNTANYWRGRIFRPRNDRGEASPHYAMRFQIAGKRVAFGLRTGNLDAAAARAAAIYNELLADGIEATLAKHRANNAPAPATLGAWIAGARAVFDKTPATFEAYARAARTIAADILRAKRTKKRFGRKGGDLRAAVDSAPLSIFTASKVQAWKIAYVRARASDPAKERGARITCNSYLRAARSLFGEGIARHMPPLEMAEKPFARVQFWPRESMRYQSKIDVPILLAAARDALADRDPEPFKILLLALCAGLRRSEIDRLLWRQVDLDAGEIRIEVTEAGGLKTADSAGTVAIDSTLCGILRGFKARARSQYVIEERDTLTRPRAWGQQYRCDATFDRLMGWLRANGVDVRTPLHTLRKEAGSLIATRKGIFAASRFLRHSDIKVTASYYADIKERVSIDLGELLPPASVLPFTLPSPEKKTPKVATP
jgi:integrase